MTARSEADETVLDDDQPAALRSVDRLEEICGRQAADLDGESDVELVTEHRQDPDQIRRCTDLAFHPTTVAPEYPAG